MIFTEDEIRDFLAICGFKVKDWQIPILTKLLNAKGDVVITMARRGT